MTCVCDNKLLPFLLTDVSAGGNVTNSSSSSLPTSTPSPTVSNFSRTITTQITTSTRSQNQNATTTTSQTQTVTTTTTKTISPSSSPTVAPTSSPKPSKYMAESYHTKTESNNCLVFQSKYLKRACINLSQVAAFITFHHHYHHYLYHHRHHHHRHYHDQYHHYPCITHSLDNSLSSGCCNWFPKQFLSG